MHRQQSIGRQIRYQGCAISAAALLALTAAPAPAAQSVGQFNVMVQLRSAGSGGDAGQNVGLDSPFCRTMNAPGSFGATVTTVCSTGALVDLSPGRSGMPWSPMHGGANRFINEVQRVGDAYQIMGADTGIGTTTMWRVINLANRDYLEMTLAW